jgi:hypothetical protein
MLVAATYLVKVYLTLKPEDVLNGIFEPENMACCNFPLSTTLPSTFVAIRGESRKKKERNKR